MSIEINGPSNPNIGDALGVDRKNEQSKSTTDKANEHAQSGKAADSINLTQSSVKLNELAKSIGPEKEVDEKRVAAIKHAIASGTYKVDADKIAKKLSTLETLLP